MNVVMDTSAPTQAERTLRERAREREGGGGGGVNN